MAKRDGVETTARGERERARQGPRETRDWGERQRQRGRIQGRGMQGSLARTRACSSSGRQQRSNNRAWCEFRETWRIRSRADKISQGRIQPTRPTRSSSSGSVERCRPVREAGKVETSPTEQTYVWVHTRQDDAKREARRSEGEVDQRAEEKGRAEGKERERGRRPQTEGGQGDVTFEQSQTHPHIVQSGAESESAAQGQIARRRGRQRPADPVKQRRQCRKK